MIITYYNCYRHYPGEDKRGKYIFEIYLDDEFVDNVYDAHAIEGWIRIKIFDSYGNVSASSKKEGNIKIVKNYEY